MLENTFRISLAVKNFREGGTTLVSYADDEVLEIFSSYFGRCKYVEVPKSEPPKQIYLQKMEERREQIEENVKKQRCGLFSDL